MVLVFLCGLFVLITLVIFLLLLSTIRMRIEKLYISNVNYDTKANEKWKKEFVFYLEIYLFNKIKLIGINLNEKRLKNFNIEQKMRQLDKFDFNKKDILNKDNIVLLKKLNINVSEFYLDMDIGTENAILTSGLVAFISTLIAIFLGNMVKEYNSDLYSFRVAPIYMDRNVIKIDLKSIVNINMVHIIYVIYMLLKKRRVYKNE